VAQAENAHNQFENSGQETNEHVMGDGVGAGDGDELAAAIQHTPLVHVKPEGQLEHDTGVIWGSVNATTCPALQSTKIQLFAQ
jgi:hypothetical protein